MTRSHGGRASTRRRVIPLIAVMLLCCTAGAVAGRVWTVQETTQVNTAANIKPGMTIDNGVPTLVPEVPRPYRIVINNPNDYPIRINRLEGFSPELPNGCKDHAVRIEPLYKADLHRLLVPPRSSIELDTQIKMNGWAAKDCSGKDLPFTVTVGAEPAA